MQMFNLFDTDACEGKNIIDRNILQWVRYVKQSSSEDLGISPTFTIIWLKGAYDYVITEVESNNHRSLGAHINYGFDVLLEYKMREINWVILIKRIQWLFH